MFFLLFINYLLYFSFCIIIYGLSVKIDFSYDDLCLRIACHKIAYAQKQRRNEDFYVKISGFFHLCLLDI